MKALETRLQLEAMPPQLVFNTDTSGPYTYDAACDCRATPYSPLIMGTMSVVVGWLAVELERRRAARHIGMSSSAEYPSGANPMMDHATRIDNRLLAALPPADFALLAPHLRKVAIERNSVLIRSGDRIEHLLFPLSGAIAAITELPNGQTVATAIIGREGAVGLTSAFGASAAPATAVARLSGAALQISPAQFLAAQHRSPAIASMVQVFTMSLLTQLQHVAACNALHSVEARLARWLLHIHDRANEGDLLPLTQETLSELLGVRRTTVTHVVCTMRASRALKSSRRGQLEIDRPRLEAVACECYKVMSRRIDRIVSHGAVGLIPGAPARPPSRSPGSRIAKTGS
ncbi:CRP-like cAMP-binding protein [Bradyrhizobium ottawaense]